MKKVYKLEGLECANCAAKIETAITKLKGVTSARVSFLTSKMTIEYDDNNIDDIVKASKDIVKKYEPHVVVTPI